MTERRVGWYAYSPGFLACSHHSFVANSRVCVLMLLVGLLLSASCVPTLGQQFPTELVAVGQVQSAPPPGAVRPPRAAANTSTSNFAVIDFSNPTSPTVAEASPGFVGTTVVDCSGIQAAVGNQNGDQVVLYDLTNPANPLPVGGVRTGLNGIGAIKFDGKTGRVLVGELAGFAPLRVLIDASNPNSPQILSTLLTGISGISSVGLSGSDGLAGEVPPKLA